jgi:hypothetical protein
MEVGQGPNWGCSVKEKKKPTLLRYDTDHTENEKKIQEAIDTDNKVISLVVYFYFQKLAGGTQTVSALTHSYSSRGTCVLYLLEHTQLLHIIWNSPTL